LWQLTRTMHRKWIHWVVALVFFVACCGWWPVPPGRAQETAGDRPAVVPVTRGAELARYELVMDGKLCRVFVLTVDLADPYLEVRPMFGKNGTLGATQNLVDMAREYGAVAALNGDFFQIKSGKPIGLTVVDGGLVTSPALRGDMYGLAFTADKQPQIMVFGFSGRVVTEAGASYPLAGVNKPGYLKQSGVSADVDSLQAYTPLWGDKSRGCDENLPGRWVEVVVSGGVVQRVVENGEPQAIPADGYVLSGHGAAADWLAGHIKPGDKINIEYALQPAGDFVSALGGQSLLVEDGKVPAAFDQEIPGLRARSAAGYSADGRYLYLVAVEGGAGSRGMTQRELAEFMVSLGAWRAVNLDGGGSTTLVARPLGRYEVEAVNTPEKGSLRKIPTAWGVFSTAPRGDLAGLIIDGPKTVLPGVPVSYTAYGYDEYFNPYPVKPNRVRWSAAGGRGRFTDGYFLPGARGEAVIRAAYGPLRQEKTVLVLGEGDMESLAVRPAAIKVMAGERVTLSVEIKSRQGQVFTVPVENVKWQVDENIGSVAGSEFVAGAEAAAGFLQAEFLGLAARVPVKVRTADTVVELVEPGKDAVVELDGSARLVFPAGWTGIPRRVEVRFGEQQLEDLPAGIEALSAPLTVSSPDGWPAGAGKPWQVEWPLRGLAVPEEREGTMKVFTRPDEESDWQAVPCRVDREENKAAALLHSGGQVVLALDNRPVPEFTDVAGHWAADAIRAMAARGVVQGFPGGEFRPGKGVTRAQFAVMLRNAMGWPAPQQEPVFRDEVPGWAAGAVAAAASRGVITGYPEGEFRPHNTLTRAEMAVIMSRMLDRENVPRGTQPPAYRDALQVPAWAAPAVARVSETGLMRGDPGGRFRPLDTVTRAEAVTVINSWYRLLNWK